MRSLAKRLSDRILSVFFPKKCVGCKTDIGFSSDFLCTECRKSFKSELDAGCLSCGKPYAECRCKPNYLSGITLITTMPYKKENSVCRELIIRCKRRKDEAVLSELADNMVKALKESCIGENFAVTYVPRSPKAFKETGFDQAKMLAKSISKKTSLPFAHTLVCRETNKEQKSLAMKMRQNNAHQRFSVTRRMIPSIRNASFILVDDVVTSGATLSRCAELLYEQGAHEVVCLCASRTVSYD